MVNSEMIKDRMTELGINQEYVAEKLKMPQSTLNLKINNARGLNLREMFELAEILEIKPLDYRTFFYK